MFYIHLHQETGEIQTVFSSESRDEITKLFTQECDATDEYTDIDELLTLSEDDVVYDWYHITVEQQRN